MPPKNTAIASSQNERELLEHCDFAYFSNTTILYNAEHSQEVLVINSPCCFAVIALQGAQLLEFRPHGQNNWLWLSPLSNFEPGKAIRGGIPICLPWFGVHQQNPQLPKHGIARTQQWQLTTINECPNKTEIVFELHYDGHLQQLAPEPFDCQLIFDISDELNIGFNLKNCSDKSQHISWAMHNYFAVDNSAKTRIYGLQNHAFLDNTENLQSFQQSGPIVFTAEVDRVYQNTIEPQRLIAHHTLDINGHHCPSCIVWNPGALSAMGMDDIQGHYNEFVCVERGCAFEDALILSAGETFRSTMQVKKIA